MRAVYTYVRCTKVITDYWDIRLSVTISFTSKTVRQFHTIKLVLESTYQTISDDMWYVTW